MLGETRVKWLDSTQILSWALGQTWIQVFSTQCSEPWIVSPVTPCVEAPWPVCDILLKTLHSTVI